jgi:KDO2-lipid IV(A) lauroyltransferase
MSPFASIPLYLVAKGMGLFATVLPRRVELFLGKWLGRIGLCLHLFKSKRAAEHIGLCFPEKCGAERAAILRANYENLGIILFGYAHMLSPIPGHYRRYVARVSRLVGLENWKRAHDKGKGVLVFSSHMANWEMSAAATGLAGINPMIVTTILKPQWFHDGLTAARKSCGADAAFHPGSMPAIQARIALGGTVAFMNDQYANPPMGEPVVFFGAQVNTLKVIGPLANRSGAAVLPVSVERDSNGVEVVTIEPELDLGEAIYDSSEATQVIAEHVEGWVRRRPEQWLWIHRRFKNAVWPDAPAAPKA